MNHSQTLRTLLESNEKNIADLISQDISLWVLAQQMLESPAWEAQTDLIFHQIYINTCNTLENLLLNICHQQNLSPHPEEISGLRQHIQLFVHELVEAKKLELLEKINWLQKKL
ncbi:MAG: hypothetical protein NW226_10575 [Microscillaceae bacterium]|nr:hypothetical protein [Microscillaceae bacterium]